MNLQKFKEAYTEYSFISQMKKYIPDFILKNNTKKSKHVQHA